MKKSLIILTLIISSVATSSVSASSNSIAFSQAEKVCNTYKTNTETYLNTVLPAYLDDNLTKSNQDSINKYKTYLNSSSEKQVDIVMWKDTVKVEFATAELFNLEKKSPIVDFIYNPFWLNSAMFPYTFTTDNIKKYTLGNDTLLYFCNTLSMYQENSSMTQEDINISTAKLQENSKEMNSFIRKHSLETANVRNKRSSPTILKNNNLSLWKFKLILDHLDTQNAKG